MSERAEPPAAGARERAPTDDASLAAALAQGLPAPVRIVARRSSPYASSFPLAELDVEAGDGTRLTVVWKDVTPGALLPGARRARGDAPPPDPARELRAYGLLEGAGLDTPRRLAAVQEPGRAWLFLEAVRGARLEHVGEPAAWEAAARWLAHAHATLTARTIASAAASSPAAAPAGAAAAAAPGFPPPWIPPDLDAIAAREPRAAALLPALRDAAARLEAAPPATIHGELYPANVVIGDDGRVCVLDWETIARGPALLDLAALTAGRWDEAGDPLARAYRDALPYPPAADAFQAELDAARLLTAARWLGAPAGWSPPPEQARDWLADAASIAARMPA